VWWKVDYKNVADKQQIRRDFAVHFQYPYVTWHCLLSLTSYGYRMCTLGSPTFLTTFCLASRSVCCRTVSSLQKNCAHEAHSRCRRSLTCDDAVLLCPRGLRFIVALRFWLVSFESFLSCIPLLPYLHFIFITFFLPFIYVLYICTSFT